MTAPSATTLTATTAIASAWPTPMGISASSTTVRLRRCRPRATANSQPMAGLMPWKAPSPTRASHDPTLIGQRPGCPLMTEGCAISAAASRVAVRVRGRVTALQAHLMRPVAVRPLDEELPVQLDAPVRLRIDLDHPALDPVRIELVVDDAVERVREVDPLAVTADLDHLRPAVERPRAPGVGRPRDDTPDPESAGELRLERVRHVVLLQVARAPAGDVEVPVVHRQIDVRDQRRAGLEALQHGGQLVRGGRLGRDVDHLRDCPLLAVPMPDPDRRRQVLEAQDAVDEAIGLRRVVRRAQLEDELVVRAEVDLLHVPAPGQVPEV